MMAQKTAPYGSWQSPITSDLIVAGTIGLGELQLDDSRIYWIESRPSEGGRNVIVTRSADGSMSDVIPQGFNARTTVHEYGGGSYIVDSGNVYFSNFADQHLYIQRPGNTPELLTRTDGLRYADGVIDRQRGQIITVREDHRKGGRDCINTIVAISMSPKAGDSNDGTIVAEGADFYSSPRLSPDGKYLAWLQWNHP